MPQHFWLPSEILRKAVAVREAGILDTSTLPEKGDPESLS
jgi:hypothetical protein